MTLNEIENSFSICGLVCTFCSCKSNCQGCRTNRSGCKPKDEECSIKECCLGKGLEYCYLCDEFPCDEDMFKNVRLRAFNKLAREEGLTRLSKYLLINHNNGIQYHKANGLKGDYDLLSSEEQIINFIKYGHLDPYLVNPVYETNQFHLRLISIDDAEALFKVYNNSEAQKYFNADNCDFGYSNVDSVDKIKFNIRLWLESYKQRAFVRLSIIDKSTDTIVGTVEMFGGTHGILRIDILPEYEIEQSLAEILSLSNRLCIDFDCNKIVSKAIPEDTQRIQALEKCGFKPCNICDIWTRKNYYIKERIK